MRHVEISVRRIAETRIDEHEIERWLTEHGVDEAHTQAMLDSQKTDAERLVECAGRRCYMSFQPSLNKNVTQIRKDIGDYLENVLKSGHGSVLEHVTFTFAIENVSRVFTGEMNRHRAGAAISEGSMRFIRYTDIPYWIPTSIKDADDPPDLAAKKHRSRMIFEAAFRSAETYYANLCEIWKDELSPESKFKAKKEITSMMRRIIPMGVATGGIWTGNIRALRHICEMRCSPAAEEEILVVATKMLNILRDEEPNFFGDFVTDDNGYSTPKYRKV